jgi:O-antigen/teichoic acid export membrane protein
LQGINEQKYSILSLLVGLLVKLSLNIPLIKLMETKGAVLATALGYTAAILINFYVIKKYARYPFLLIWRRSLLIFIFAAIMWAGTGLTYKFLLLFLSPALKMQSIIIIIISAIVGAAIYFYLGSKSGLTKRLLGERFDRILSKLRIPRRRRTVEN